MLFRSFIVQVFGSDRESDGIVGFICVRKMESAKDIVSRCLLINFFIIISISVWFLVCVKFVDAAQIQTWD